MADEYVQYPLESDAAVLADEALAALGTAVPGWTPSAGHLETILIEAMATMVAQAIEVGTTVPVSIFRYWGGLVGVSPVEASPAEADTTWVARDTAGYTVKAGTLAGYRVAGDELIGFRVTADVVIPPGSSTTATGAVAMQAITTGEEANGGTGTMEMIDALAWVDSVTISGTIGGGAEGETDADYLARLSRELELMTPSPVLPDDFSVLASRVSGVGRATTVDGLNPTGWTTGNERMVTVAVIDEDGANVPSLVKTEVDDLLQGMREVSFIVWVIDPSRETVNVAFTAVAHSGYDAATVEAAAEAAVADYLDPATWGLPPGGDPSTHGGWRNVNVVRYLEVAAALNAVEGLDYVTALTINSGTSDITFTDPITLPTPGTISGTVTAP